MKNAYKIKAQKLSLSAAIENEFRSLKERNLKRGSKMKTISFSI